MPSFTLVHSTGGSPDETFFPWLRKELEKKECKVYAPQFPPPEKQSLQTWMEAFEPYWKYVNEETCFVGRSIGPAFILRLLEKAEIKIKAAFLIAGFCSELGLPQFKPLISTFVDKPFDWQKIRSGCGSFFVYNSDNDRYVPLEKGWELAKNLGCEVTVVKGADHFYFKKFPQLLKDVKGVLK